MNEFTRTVNRLNDDDYDCYWDLEDPMGCYDPDQCGCYTDPCEAFGYEAEFCESQPCDPFHESCRHKR